VKYVRYDIRLGRPTHFRTNSGRIACGLVSSTAIAGYDARDTDCLACIRTKKWKTYMGAKEAKL
jgi:hypothetical protein